MPVFFALTMFVSALLLFLVQPMVGKMVLPLLGGTPAVWNTCMVFFQAFLLAGYFYAHKVSTNYDSRRQTRVHLTVLFIALAALAIGSVLSSNHSPIPIVKGLSPQGQDYPFFGVIALLFVAIGLPFFVVSTTAPLLQKWFVYTGHPSSRDPYFLYAASNFGSLLALVMYPIFVEPNLKLVEQAWIWAIGFAAMVAMIWVCARMVLNAPPPKPPFGPKGARPQIGPAGAAVAAGPADDAPPPTWGQRLRWLGLAFVPSSLMLSVTTFVSTDIASLPLMWIIPLSLYLITFIIAFSRVPRVFHLIMTLIAPVLVLLLVFLDTSGRKPDSFLLIIVIHMVTFFAVAMVCHGELAHSRPSAKWLTSFYLTMSLGGMLGGMFNSLVAPIVFNFVTEYPITLIAACLLLPKLTDRESPRDQSLGDLLPGGLGKFVREQLPGLRVNIYDVMIPLGIFVLSRILVASNDRIYSAAQSVIRALDLKYGTAGTITQVIVYGLPAMLCYFFVERPIRFGLCVAALLLASYVAYLKASDDELYHDRSFFGTLKIEEDRAHRSISKERYMLSVPPEDFNKGKGFYERVVADGEEEFREVSTYRRLVHGTTLHGKQLKDAETWGIMAALSPLASTNVAEAMAFMGGGAWESWQFPGRDPLTYYHRAGPVGSIFDAWRSQPRQSTDIACIGLGTGTLSSYGLPGQKMTFFEIDTHVRRLVEEPKYFTYIHSARQQGVKIEFAMGDARVSLERMEGRKWGLMLVDAFSSDAIPVHLLTKQSVQLYFDRVTDDGIVALHISNRYLDLEPVVERIAQELKLEARVMNVSVPNRSADAARGFTSSTWIALARTREALGKIEESTQRWFDEGGAERNEDDLPPRWQPLRANDKVGLWTDDYSPIKNILKF